MTTLPVGQFLKVLASTTGQYVEGMQAQVYNFSPIFESLITGGRKKVWTGESVRVKLFGEEYKDAESYQDFDTGDTTKSEPFTRADYELGGYRQFMTLAGMEVRKNKGTGTKLFDLVKAETQIAVSSIRNSMAKHLYQTTNDAKGILSLYTLTDASTTIAGVAGGSKWGGTSTVSASFILQGKNDFYTMFLTLSQYAGLGGKTGQKSQGQPDLIIMNNTTTLRYYIAAMEPSMRYEAGGKGDIGFGSLSFMGKKVVGDPFCGSAEAYFINTDSFEVHTMPDADFTSQGERAAYNQDAYTVPILWNGQIICLVRRLNGKLTAIAA